MLTDHLIDINVSVARALAEHAGSVSTEEVGVLLSAMIDMMAIVAKRSHTKPMSEREAQRKAAHVVLEELEVQAEHQKTDLRELLAAASLQSSVLARALDDCLIATEAPRWIFRILNDHEAARFQQWIKSLDACRQALQSNPGKD